MNPGLFILVVAGSLAQPGGVFADRVAEVVAMSRDLAEVEKVLVALRKALIDEALGEKQPDPKTVEARAALQADTLLKLGGLVKRNQDLRDGLLRLAQRLEQGEGEGPAQAKVVRKALDLFAKEGLDNRLGVLHRQLTGGGFKSIEALERAIREAQESRKLLLDCQQVLLGDREAVRRDAIVAADKFAADLAQIVTDQKSLREELLAGKGDRAAQVLAHRALAKRALDLAKGEVSQDVARLVLDAGDSLRKAGEALEKGDKELTKARLDQALADLDRAGKRSAVLAAQLREEEQERYLSELLARSERIIASQKVVRTEAEGLRALLKANAGQPTPEQLQKLAALSDRQEELAAEVNKLVRLVEAGEDPGLLRSVRACLVPLQEAARALRNQQAGEAGPHQEKVISSLGDFRAAVQRALDRMK